MFKKIGVVTALSTALLFGGSISSVDASANADQSQNQPYKIYYSVNGGEFNSFSGDWNSFTQEKLNSIIGKYLNNFQINWNTNNQNAEKQEPAQEKQQPEQNQQPKEEVKQPEQNQQPKEEVKQPEQNQQSKEETKQPEQNQESNQQTEQQKQPEQTEAPTQQPSAEQQEQQNQGQSQQLNQFEQQVVELTNQEREKQGLAPLKVDTELSKVARAKSKDMQQNGYFAHNSPTYGSPFDMMKQFGIDYRTAGENIARGQRTPEEVVNAWMNSEGHRANILNPDFTHIGVGYVEQGNYWTQQFIGK